jgi:CBS domain-containing protein
LLDGAVPRGVFTERDLAHLLADGFVFRGTQRHLPLREVMSRAPVTARRGNSLAEALDKMSTAGVRHLVVVDDKGELRGLLTIADVLQFVLDQFPEETVNLPPRLRQQYHRREGA